MMMGRDESMPNVVREPDITSDERDQARETARELLAYHRRGTLHVELFHGSIAMGAIETLARAALRYVPEGVPAPAPHEVAAADDRTRPAPLPASPAAPYTGSPALDFPAPGVICEPIDPVEESSGVCEVSDDSSTSQNRLNFTGMYDINVHGDHTKR